MLPSCQYQYGTRNRNFHFCGGRRTAIASPANTPNQQLLWDSNGNLGSIANMTDPKMATSTSEKLMVRCDPCFLCHHTV